jgi:hypothetical protein
MSSRVEARCFVIADLRGDFPLLCRLMCELLQVATYVESTKSWAWVCERTTVICLGNFIDRYEVGGVNQQIVSTTDAIEGETAIITCFKELQHLARTDRKDNAMVVLMGDHEVANLCRWPKYTVNQLPSHFGIQDERLRHAFVETILRPFCLEQGLVAGWGIDPAVVYVSHATLEIGWLRKVNARSIGDLNQKWRSWLKHRDFVQLPRLADTTSPVVSSKVVFQMNTWRDNDRSEVADLFGKSPYPLFVTACTPAQTVLAKTLESSIISDGGSVAISRDYDGTQQVYFLHNGMADAFCGAFVNGRRPQALRFTLKEIPTLEGDAIYLDQAVIRLNESSACPKRIAGHRPVQEMMAIAKGEFDDDIEQIIVIWVSKDRKKLVVERRTNLETAFQLPFERRRSKEKLELTLGRCLARLEMGPWDKSHDHVAVDYFGNRRIFLYQGDAASTASYDSDADLAWLGALLKMPDHQSPDLLSTADRHVLNDLQAHRLLPMSMRGRSKVDWARWKLT